MRRVTATNVRETNLKCEVSHEVKGDQTPPTVAVTFGKSRDDQLTRIHY